VRASRRQLLLLAVLVAVAIAIVRWRGPAAPVGDAAPVRTTANAQAPGAGSPVADIRLELLDGRTDNRVSADRNLFRFEARRVASAAPTGARRRAVPVEVPTGPPPPALPPPPPPIPLRFIGYLDQEGAVPRLAVLSDGRGNVFSGKEGDIIEGRYRVLRVGTDSADLIYVDGRGRQTIRLSGQ